MIKTNEIQIENASIHDAEEILELQKAAFLGQAQIYNNFRLPPLVQTIESIKDEFASKTFLKATFSNQIIASVKFRSSGNVVHIDRLIVYPTFQNQGVGTYLMRTLEDRFPSSVVFQLFTGEKSSRNVHLYTKLGFQLVRKEITDQGIVLVHMEKHHNKDRQADAADAQQ
ncbi:MAG: GNAT family N-acetyltransferase [Smithella sp.]